RQRIAFFSLPEGEGGEDRRSEPGGEISPPRLASLGDPPLRGGKSLTYARLPRALRKNSDGGRSSTRSARTSCPAPPGRTPCSPRRAPPRSTGLRRAEGRRPAHSAAPLSNRPQAPRRRGDPPCRY